MSERDRCPSGTRRCGVYGWPWDRIVSGHAKRIDGAALIAGPQRAANRAGTAFTYTRVVLLLWGLI